MDGRQITFKLRNHLVQHSNVIPKVYELACFLKSFSNYSTENNVNGR